MQTSLRNRFAMHLSAVAVAIAIPGITASQAAPAAPADAKFVKEAAMGDLFEVQAGKLALTKASSPDVQRLAKRVVEDHAQADQELKSLAQAKGITDLPQQLDAKHQEQLDKLSRASGPAFDRTYASMMVDDHQKDLKEFRSEARKASDGDVRQFASKVTPKLEDHLALAETAKRSTSR